MHRIVVIMIITNNIAPTLAPMIKPMLDFVEGWQLPVFGLHKLLFPS